MHWCCLPVLSVVLNKTSCQLKGSALNCRELLEWFERVFPCAVSQLRAVPQTQSSDKRCRYETLLTPTARWRHAALACAFTRSPQIHFHSADYDVNEYGGNTKNARFRAIFGFLLEKTQRMSYCETLTANHIRSIEWCHRRRPWVSDVNKTFFQDQDQDQDPRTTSLPWVTVSYFSC